MDQSGAMPAQVSCCVVGGGPAGMMTGFLLARAGVDTLVLEKHKDFLRDFRGDTVHPSTLDVIDELGLLDRFLQRPHQQLAEIRVQIGEREITVADFRHTPTRCHFIALMPQWDFLDFLAEHARALPRFRVAMQCEAVGLIEEAGRIAGVRTAARQGPAEIRADLVIAADGRHSAMRAQAGFEVESLGAPIDVLWMRLSKRSGDPVQSLGRLNFGRMLVMLDRGDYWQCAYVIRKGGYDEIRSRGLERFRDDVARIAPFFRDRLGELGDWDHIKLLTVAVDRLKQWWRPGLLCIGDAAHAMSPIGGIGINLAIQDAVAAANILADPLRRRTLTADDLRAVQRRRSWPTRATQRLQVVMQERVIDPVLQSEASISAPWPVRLFDHLPWLRRVPARVIGVGFRPEHVRCAAVVD